LLFVQTGGSDGRSLTGVDKKTGRFVWSTVLGFLEQLDVSGIEFVSVRDAIDTSTAAGRLLRVILAGFAAYENEIRSERISAGIKKARREGKEWGGRQENSRLQDGSPESRRGQAYGQDGGLPTSRGP
jgi:DNA invertase Pin-like site-specific DNA recombinase